MLDVSLVGTGGMMPLPNRFLTALMCRLNGHFLLIDCGEGTQVSLKMLGWGFKNIDVICITHFHADHISGLPGMLLTIGNSGREEPLTIIGPKGLLKTYKGLSVIFPELPFEVNCIEIDDDNENEEFDVSGFLIKPFKAEHRITCYAYSVTVKRKGKFNPLKADALGVPKIYWSVLQKGESVEYGGITYTSDMVMGDERKGIKLCYCTDSRPVEGLVKFAHGSDLFICEGMYGDEEKLEKVAKYKHMLFGEAAQIAKEADVKELWLTHFSPALTEPKEFEYIAKNIFENSVVGEDRMCKTILFDED